MTDTRSALQIRRDMIARPKGVTPHICETPDCPYTGKPSPDSCACHLTEIACLRALNAELLAALERAFSLIKNSGFQSGLEEAEFDATLFQVGTAIAKAQAKGE